MPYDLFLYNVPKVSDDGERAIPVPPSETHELDDLEAARRLAAERKDDFDRVVVIHRDGDKQRRVERYVEGVREEVEAAVPA